MLLFGRRKYPLPAVAFDVYDQMLIGCQQGFLVHTAARQFAFYNWDGQRKWAVTTAAIFPKMTIGGEETGMSMEQGNGIVFRSAMDDHYHTADFTISPSGRYFAALAIQEGKLWLQRWTDGKPTADRIAGELAGFTRRVKGCALDDGYLLVWPNDDSVSNTPIYLILGDRCAARAVVSGYGTLSFAPDGNLAFFVQSTNDSPMLGRYVTRTTGTLRLAPWFDATHEELSVFNLCAGRQLITRGGTLILPTAGRRALLPGGYTLCGRDCTANRLVARKDGGYAVLDLMTGRSWLFTVPGETDAFTANELSGNGSRLLSSSALWDVTPDGRQVLVPYYQPERLHGLANDILDHLQIPNLPGYSSYLAVYTRQGKCMYMLPFTDLLIARLSPTGSSVVAIADRNPDFQGEKMRCEIYRVKQP